MISTPWNLGRSLAENSGAVSSMRMVMRRVVGSMRVVRVWDIAWWRLVVVQRVVGWRFLSLVMAWISVVVGSVMIRAVRVAWAASPMV